jgi:amidase
VNGVVGLKPTVGLVSRDGVVPISGSQDTPGPMARSVADAALLLDAMVGADARDAATARAKPVAGGYVAHLRAGGLRGARIGLVRKSMGFHAGVDAHMERAVAALRSAGAEVIDVEIATAGKWGRHEFKVLLAEFRPALERYLDDSGAPVRTLQSLVEYNRAHAAEEMPYFAQELFEQTLKAPVETSKEYVDARAAARRLAGPQGIDATLKKHRLDALLAPATAPAWKIDTVLGDHFVGAGYGAAAVAGYPSITVPMGEVRGLPVGLVFMGTAWSEPRLIEIAYGYEQATKARIAPRFIPTLETLAPVLRDR